MFSAGPAHCNGLPEVWVDNYPLSEDFDGDEYFATIQAAVNAVAGGGTVHVAAGSYEGPVNIDKPVRLVSDDPSTLIVGPYGSDVVRVEHTHDVLIANFTIMYGGRGVHLDHVYRSEVRNCRVIGSTMEGVRVSLSERVEIAECVVNEAGKGVSVLYTDFFDLRNLEILNCAYSGILVLGSRWGVIRDSRVYNSSPGIDLQCSREVTIDTTALNSNRREGVYISCSSEVVLYKCLSSHNEGSGLYATCVKHLVIDTSSLHLNNLHGVQLSITDRALLFKSSINYNGNTGLYAENSKKLSINRCGIAGNGEYGVWIDRSELFAGGNSIVDNRVGVYASDAQAILHYNWISGNFLYGLVGATNSWINATHNWWGDAGGPSGEGLGAGDRILDLESALLEYEPWLTSAALPLYRTALMDLWSLYARFGVLNATLVYGSSLPHGPLHPARVEDVVGGTMLAEALSEWGWRGALESALDIEVYNEVLEAFFGSGLKPIIAIGGPGVNYGWWHYNRIFTANSSSLHAWFVVSGGRTVVRTSTGRVYRANSTHTFAIVQLYWDQGHGRPALLVAGLTGRGTRAACEWLASRIESWDVIAEGAAAVVLAVDKMDPTRVTVEERIVETP